MPDGIYLNAYDLDVAEIVRQMNSSIQDSNKYYSYFKWHKYYTFHSPEENEYTDNYCTFCTTVNDFMRRKQRYSYKRLADWWNPLTNEQTPKPVYVPVVKIIRNIN